MQKRKSLVRSIGSKVSTILLAPFAGLLAALGMRFARISNPGRIGHMAAEMDCFLKERALGLIPDHRPVLLLERRRAGNRALLDIFRGHMPVWDKRWQKLICGRLAKIDALSLPLGRPVVGLGEAARYSQVLALWGDRPPVIGLPADIEARGRACLAELGVPDDAWFVCAHAREAGYSPRDDRDHAHRNADIRSYGGAIREITGRGGWVVRVGDPSMTPMTPMDKVVDYAVSPLKSDWMDLWLCAHNRFFVGTTSGLTMVATMFQKPCVQVNMIPLGASLGMSEADISIPKRLVGKDGAPLALAEVFRSGLSVQRYAQVFEDAGVTIVDNTEEEIAAVVKEMLERLDGRFETTDDDEDLQRRFRALLRPVDYSYGSLARIGRDWLRENRDLL